MPYTTKELDKLTAMQIRKVARSFRAVAARTVGYPETAVSFLRLAERYEDIARQREVEAIGAGDEGGHGSDGVC
jgi:hypothetical protein